jgi:hypothetical protein
MWSVRQNQFLDFYEPEQRTMTDTASVDFVNLALVHEYDFVEFLVCHGLRLRCPLLHASGRPVYPKLSLETAREPGSPSFLYMVYIAHLPDGISSAAI